MKKLLTALILRDIKEELDESKPVSTTHLLVKELTSILYNAYCKGSPDETVDKISLAIAKFHKKYYGYGVNRLKNIKFDSLE